MYGIEELYALLLCCLHLISQLCSKPEDVWAGARLNLPTLVHQATDGSWHAFQKRQFRLKFENVFCRLHRGLSRVEYGPEQHTESPDVIGGLRFQRRVFFKPWAQKLILIEPSRDRSQLEEGSEFEDIAALSRKAIVDIDFTVHEACFMNSCQSIGQVGA
eukprot:TRINITY_DN7094_c0_g1_i1.p1 TRINITY_DN7094_c0_g1~~TRINITY_DN7094_c0_g1_i1.p1  ORF type:complete len:160 (-),score=10.40 TRINITY_DN7094_c0_g1_i1:531-1010(-)